MAVTLRPVTPDDESFLFAVYAATRAEEMAMVPWTAEQKESFLRMQFTAQSQDYLARFPQAQHSIICVDAEPVGRLYVAEIEDRIKILDITVLPEFRRKGAATLILTNLFARSTIVGKPLRIFAERHNPSVGYLERLGFSKIEESDFNYQMEWSHQGPRNKADE